MENKNLKFGDIEIIKKLKLEFAEKWLRNNHNEILEDIMETLNIEHVGVCPECGHDIDCDEYDLGCRIEEISDKLIVIDIVCDKCDIWKQVTIINWGTDEYEAKLGKPIDRDNRLQMEFEKVI